MRGTPVGIHNNNLVRYSLKFTAKNFGLYLIRQWSPTFLSPGTGFVEDNFSMDWGAGGMVQAVMGAMGSDAERQMKLCLLACRSPPAVWPGS